MKRRVLGGVLAVALWTPSLLALLSPARSCTCIRACCCAPDRSSSTGHSCHRSPQPDRWDTRIRCRHPESEMRLSFAPGLIPPVSDASPVGDDTPAAETPAMAPHDGFTCPAAPPPKDLSAA